MSSDLSLISANERLLTSGVFAGVTSSITFIFIHHILIAPIWFILPFAAMFGALTGISLTWSYKVIFDKFSTFNTVKLFAIYTIPVFVLEVTTFIFLEKSYTLEEAMDPNATDDLLSLAFKIVIPFSIIYGLIQGFLLGRSRELILSSVSTNFIIFTGIGHNLPIFNVVESDNSNFILRIKLLTWLLLLVLIISFAITLHLLVKRSQYSTVNST